MNAVDVNDNSQAVKDLEGEYVGRAQVLAVLAKFGIEITQRTLDRWQQGRNGPPRIRIGRSIVYKISDLREWLDRNVEGRQRPRPIPRRATSKKTTRG